MTKHLVLHTRKNIYRRYASRKEGGRGLPSSEDCVAASKQENNDYIKKNKERLIIVINNSMGNKSMGKKNIKTKKQKWEEKQVYGHFKPQLHTGNHQYGCEREISRE